MQNEDNCFEETTHLCFEYRSKIAITLIYVAARK